MANAIWGGRDVGNEGDWSVAANFAPAAVPGNGDDVWVPAGSYAIINGLAQGAVTLDSLNVDRLYLENIGASGGPLVINATEVRMMSGGAECWLDGTFTTFRAAPRQFATNALRIDGGTITDLLVYTGEVHLVTGLTVTNLHIVPEGRGASVPFVVIPVGVTLSTLINMDGGKLELSVGVTTVHQGNGTLVQKAGTVTTSRIRGGVHRIDGGVLTTINIHNSGKLDGTHGSEIRTVTTINLYGPDTIADVRNGAGALVPGTVNQFAGGQYFPDN